jgi:hypothetical protein
MDSGGFRFTYAGSTQFTSNTISKDVFRIICIETTMNEGLKILCELCNIKMREIYVDEHKKIGWTEISCTDVELEKFYNLIIRNYEIINNSKKDNLQNEKME